MNPRSEPLLWVQLIALGALPLELLLLLLLLAGGDPGPLPPLERLLTWGLGAAAPGVWLWRRPADLRSLLLVREAMPDATPQQLQLAALQTRIPARLLFILGVAGLLPLLSWFDRIAALASQFSPIQDGNRLSSLLLAAILLALIVWQWQQLTQALWLLSRSPAQLAAAASLDAGRLAAERSNPGLPLLLLTPLAAPVVTEPAVALEASTAAIAVEPEQASKENEGADLDQQVD